MAEGRARLLWGLRAKNRFGVRGGGNGRSWLDSVLETTALSCCMYVLVMSDSRYHDLAIVEFYGAFLVERATRVNSAGRTCTIAPTSSSI
jgi:hypothetical protein